MANKSAEGFAKAWSSNAADTLVDFIEGLKDSERLGASTIELLDELSLKEVRLSDTLRRSANASDLFRNSIEMANEAWRDNNALQTEAQLKFETSASRLQLMENGFYQLKVAIGDSLLPTVNEVAGGLTDTSLAAAEFLKNNKEVTQSIVILTTALGVGIGTITAYTAVTKGLAAAKKFLASANVIATTSQKGFAAALWATPIGKITIALTALSLILSTVAIAQAENNAKQAEAKQRANELTQELNSQISAIDELKSKIGDEGIFREVLIDLMGRQNNKYAEELSAISDTNKVRERAIELLDEEAKARARETVRELGSSYKEQRNFLDNPYTDALDTLSKIEKNRLKIHEDFYKQLSGQIDFGQAVVDSYETAQAILDGTYKSAQELADNIEDIDLEVDIKVKFRPQIDNINIEMLDLIEDLVKESSNLKSAFEDLDAGGQIQHSTMTSLLKDYPELLKYYDTERNTLTVTKSVLDALFYERKRGTLDAIAENKALIAMAVALGERNITTDNVKNLANQYRIDTNNFADEMDLKLAIHGAMIDEQVAQLERGLRAARNIYEKYGGADSLNLMEDFAEKISAANASRINPALRELFGRSWTPAQLPNFDLQGSLSSSSSSKSKTLPLDKLIPLDKKHIDKFLSDSKLFIEQLSNLEKRLEESNQKISQLTADRDKSLAQGNTDAVRRINAELIKENKNHIQIWGSIAIDIDRINTDIKNSFSQFAHIDMNSEYAVSRYRQNLQRVRASSPTPPKRDLWRVRT